MWLNKPSVSASSLVIKPLSHCQVGLSGSSAIVVAAFRSLLKFHGLTIADLGISQTGILRLIVSVSNLLFGHLLILIILNQNFRK
jgi:hypothetical protein